MKTPKITGITMGFRLFPLIVYIGLIMSIDAKFDSCAETFCEPDPTENFNKWDFVPEQETLYIDLYEERELPTRIAIINCETCDENNSPKVGSFENGDSDFLKMKVEKIVENQYMLQIENRQDFENQNQRDYVFNVILPKKNFNIFLKIIDIDDVAPSIIAEFTLCNIKENMVGPSDCTFKVEDPDSSEVKYEVDNFAEIFAVIDDSSNSIVKAVSETARLHLLKELDFETQPTYSFNVIATDKAGHQGSTIVIVKVKDVSDMPPVWMKIFATQTFKEHDTTQKYYVLAKDGDIEVNAPIKYKFENEKCHKNITVNENNGEIRIGDIDRDEPEIEDNTIKCSITAYEDDEIGNYTTSEIIFIIQDINDRIPEIKLNKPDICMNENEIIQFDNIFSVNDIDQGVNAQYDVELSDDKYSKAFQIIPSSGYRNWNFAITVVDPKLLDYEEEDWRNFKLTVRATDKGSPKLQDEKTINVCLYNMNNNVPTFVTTNFEVNMPENTKANENIINILATDKDTDDYVTYEITMGQDKFDHVSDSSDNSTNIYTIKDNVFDYEKQKEVFFQVTIQDHLNSSENMVHQVSQQIKIIVDDINDEKPRITLLSTDTPEVKEHSENYKIEDVLEAEDVDTTANLKFNIIWEETYGMKEGKKKTDKDLFENVFDIEHKYDKHVNGSTNYGRANASLVVKDKKKLDWEEFEILYLKIKVEDINQVENKPGIDVATMAIIIIDINDSPPKLNPVSDKFRVTEEAEENTYIGSVFATDKDGPGNNEIEYELTPINGTKAGLIKIDKTSGELKVDQNQKIDADCPPTWKLYYNVTAKDPVIAAFYDTKKLNIEIDDTNNKPPRLENELKTVEFNEGEISKKDKPIIIVNATDDDRDLENRNLVYEINGEFNLEIIDYFEIDQKGNVFVKKPLMWTKQKESVEVNLLIKDKKGLAGHKYIKPKFTLNIIDIDNNSPVLPKDVNFSPITEADKKGTQVAKITATDDDKPCTDATKIDYKIIKIMNTDEDKEIKEEIFKIESKEKDCVFYGNVVTNKNLTEYYGNFRITVTATNPLPENNDKSDYDLKITPFNFREPSITNPRNRKIILRLEQKIDDILIQIDNNVLKDFTATDNQNNKFSMAFSLETIQGNDIFKFKSTGKSAAQLQLKKLPEDEKFLYTINVKAWHNGTGNSASEVEETYDIYFLDVNQSPFFDKNATLEIEENDESYYGNFPEAIDPKCSVKIDESCAFTTYYHILQKNEFFHIPDLKKPILYVKKPLDYEKQTIHELTIVATNNELPPQGEQKNSLSLTINVIDVNDEPPVFDTHLYLGGMSSGLTLNSEILTVHATDVDTNDQQLRYEIEKDSMEISDDSLKTIKDDPFIIDSKSGVIRNNFSPVVDMKGFLLFKVNAFDTGDTHKDTAEVKISIITDKNKIAFTFNNDVNLVKAKSLEVSQVFTNELQYNCSIDSINKKMDSGAAIDNQTEVTTHFINPENNEPVPESAITVKTDDIEVLSRLSLRFEDIGLDLNGIKKNVEEEIENMENLLRTLLIVVSVVLSTLIIILIIAFVLRTRSLNKRLASMTTNIFGSTKSDLNRIGTSAPGTNKHAVEANPVWNTDINNGAQFDSISQTSGGSDLIGIEDNPEFQYSNKRRDSINPMYQNSMVGTSFGIDDDDINSLPGSNI